MVFLLCGKIIIISVAKVPNFVDIGRDTFLSFCHFDWMHQHAIIVSTLEFAERSIRQFINCRNNLNLTIVVLPTNYLVRACNKIDNRVYNLMSVVKVIFLWLHNFCLKMLIWKPSLNEPLFKNLLFKKHLFEKHLFN